jgi:hypothetical protein
VCFCEFAGQNHNQEKLVEKPTATALVEQSKQPQAAAGANGGSLPSAGNGSGLPAIASEAEYAAVAAYLAKAESKTPMARTKIEMHSGVAHLSFDHANQSIGLALVANAFGTGSSRFATGLLAQLTDVSRTGEQAKSSELDFMLTVVQGIGPRSEIEALLAAQMAAIHNATMSAARRLNLSQTIAQQDSASTALNKLARTFAAQVEALKRHRSDGEPSIKMQRVTVNDGGQAIVGNVQHGGHHESHKSVSSDQPCGALASGAALLGNVQALTAPVSSTSGARQESVPVPRRPRRRAKGQS